MAETTGLNAMPAGSTTGKAVIIASNRSVASDTTALDSCYSYCAQRSVEVVSVITEKSASALRLSNPVHQMLERLRSGAMDFTVIVGFSVTELFGDTPAMIGLLESAFEAGITIETVREGPLTPGTTNFNLAEARLIYRAAKSALLVNSGRARAAAYRICGYPVGRAPIGYKNSFTDGGEPTFAVDTKAAETIRELFKMAANGATIHSLVIFADRMGLRTASGLPLSSIHINKILRNQTYTGTQARAEVPGNYPAIADIKVFEAVQAILASRGKASSGREN